LKGGTILQNSGASRRVNAKARAIPFVVIPGRAKREL
jgi:hypothetical protein